MGYKVMTKSDYLAIKHEDDITPADAKVGFMFRKNCKPYIGQTAIATEIIGVDYSINPNSHVKWKEVKQLHFQEVKFRIVKDE